jgi:hypothetical protein
LDNCLLQAAWGKLQMLSIFLVGKLFPWKNFRINFDKEGFGYILGDFFNKLIWSPWMAG